MDIDKERCWAEISLDALEHNYRIMRERLPEGCHFLGVVKADAYGHGAVRVAERLEKTGADYLAVASAAEAMELREAGIKMPVLILGRTAPEEIGRLIKNSVVQTVDCLEDARAYSEAAAAAGGSLSCHLKIDSGMGRLGFDTENVDEAEKAILLPGLRYEGAFTHFAVSDECDEQYTRMQFDSFTASIDKLEEDTGVRFKIRHCANSGAMVNYSWTWADMVRPGLLLYGVDPCPTPSSLDLRPVMTLKTRVAQIKTIKAGNSVSYGRHWMAKDDTRVAVLSIGYADGLHRALSGKASFLLNGKRIPIIGNICMDMTMADISAVPDAKVGDEVLVFGGDGKNTLPLSELASLAGTIPYELMCAVSKRVSRIY